MRARAIGFLVVILLLFDGCQTKAPKPAASAEWDAFVSQFMDAYFAENPPFAGRQGKHEFDGKLPDFSAEGIRKQIAALKANRQKAAAFEAGRLDERQQFERDYVVSVVDRDLFWLETAAFPFKNPAFYSDPLDPNVYVTRDYAPAEQRLRALTSYARAVPVAVQQIRSNLRTPIPRTFIDIGKLTFGGIASYLEKDVPAV